MKLNRNHYLYMDDKGVFTCAKEISSDLLERQGAIPINKKSYWELFDLWSKHEKDFHMALYKELFIGYWLDNKHFLEFISDDSKIFMVCPTEKYFNSYKDVSFVKCLNRHGSINPYKTERFTSN